MDGMDESVPSYDEVMGLVREQKAVITALNDKITKLEERTGASEERIASLSSLKVKKGAVEEKTATDEAYEKVLLDLGITPTITKR